MEKAKRGCLLCRLIGHKWVDGVKITAGGGGWQYSHRETCARCGETQPDFFSQYERLRKNLEHVIDTLGWFIDELKKDRDRPGINWIIDEVDKRMATSKDRRK